MKKITLMIMLLANAIGFSQPTTNAPDPTRLQADVISVFSNSFTSIGTNFNPQWGQSGFGTANVAFNPTGTGTNICLAYTNFNYQGNELTPSNLTTGGMEKLHLDVWTPNCTSLEVYLVSVSNGERKVTLTPTLSGWNSFDITLTDYSSQSGFPLTAIKELKYVSVSPSTSAIYIDNVYFWKTPGAPAALDLLLGFETTETGGVDGGPFGNMAAPVLEPGTGSNTSRVLKFVGNTAGDVWQGINLNLTSNVNLTSTQTMTIDVKSATPIYFLSKVTRGLSGAPVAAASVYHNGDNTWQTLTFVFNTALDGQAVLANGVYQGFVIHAYWANGATTFGTVTRDSRTFYVDNIRGPLAVVVPTCTDGIMNGTETGVDCGGSCPACPQPPAVAAPTPPARPVADVLSVFSNAYANVAVTEWGPNWGPSSTVVDAITIATDPTKRANMTSGKTFFGIVLTDYTNLTDFTHFHMDYWVPSPVLAGQVLSFKLSNHAAQAGETSAIQALPTPTAGSWVSVDVPLSDFAIAGGGSALRNSIKEIVVSGARANNNQALDFYFDNLYFHKNTILGTQSFSALNIKMYPNPAKNLLNIEAISNIEKVSVYNMLGQEVISKSVGVQSISLDVSNLQSGMYIIKTNIDGVTAASRFVKE